MRALIEPDGTIHSGLYVFRPRKKGYGYELWTARSFTVLPNHYIADVPTYWGLISVMFVALQNVHELGHDVEKLSDLLSCTVEEMFPDDCEWPFRLHVGED